MTTAEQMREYLRTVGATCKDSIATTKQIRAALGLDRSTMGSCISDLKRAGYVIGVGKPGSMGYYLTGKVPPVPMTEEELKQRERDRNIERRRINGSVSRAEYYAACAAKREANAAARKAQRKATRDAKRTEGEQLRAELKAAAAKVRAAKKVAKTVAKVRAVAESNYRFTSTAPVKQQIAPPQSVEEWLAQGGTVERLDAFAVSKPFRAIGFNNREAA